MPQINITRHVLRVCSATATKCLMDGEDFYNNKKCLKKFFCFKDVGAWFLVVHANDEVLIQSWRKIKEKTTCQESQILLSWSTLCSAFWWMVTVIFLVLLNYVQFNRFIKTSIVNTVSVYSRFDLSLSLIDTLGNASLQSLFLLL
jgi:hypothetical protein